MIGHSIRPSERQAAAETEPPTGGHQTIAFQLDERRLGARLLVIIAALLTIGTLSRLAFLYLSDMPGRDFLAGLFRLDSEANLPTLFSTLLLLGAAAGFAVIARAKSQAGDRFAHVWWGLMWVFVYLGVDENAQLHERPAMFIKHALHTGGYLTYAWVIPYAALTLALLVALLRFLAHLPAPTRNAFLAAGFMYVMGAMGFEVIEAKLVSGLSGYGPEHPAYIALVTVEEGLEMCGLTLLIVTLLGYWRKYMPGSLVEITSALTARARQS